MPLRQHVVAVLVLAAAVAATARPEAQTRDDRPVALVGIVGAGSFADDEGSLGGGVVLGGGASVRLSDRARIEAVVTSTRHAQDGSISWEGRPTAVTGRWLYLFGGPGARTRAFVGVGVGGGHYAGTRTDTVFDAPGAPPRQERVTFTVNGVAGEAGGGVEIEIGSRLFLRPEAWLLLMGGSPSHGLEPTFTLPRAGLSVGLRL